MRDSHPLSRDQLRQFVRTASDMSAGYRLVGHILPFTGLFVHEFTHLHRDWIKTSDPVDTPLATADELRIEVPVESACKETLRFTERNKHGEGHTVAARESCCQYCQPADRWRLPFDHRSRTIPVTAEPAVDTLKWWFQQYNSNPCLPRIAQRIKVIAETAGLDTDQDLTSFALRDTFGVALLESGFEIERIADIMGYAHSWRIKSLLEHTNRSESWWSGGRVSNESYIEELRRLGKALNRPPTFREMNDRGEYSPASYQSRFGGWNAALRAAGFEPPHKGRSYIPDEKLLTDLRRLSRKVGGTPTCQEIKDYGEYSLPTYYSRFGDLETSHQCAGLIE